MLSLCHEIKIQTKLNNQLVTAITQKRKKQSLLEEKH
jgi:hypothetical protein